MRPRTFTTFSALAARTLYLVILTMLLVVPLIIIPHVTTRNPAVNSKEFATCVLLPVVFGLALLLRHPRRLWARLTLAETAILGFVGTFIVSSLFSGRIRYCLQEYWFMWAWILAGLLLGRVVGSVRDLSKVAGVVGCAGVLASIYGVSKYVGVDFLRFLYSFDYIDTGRNFVHSFFGNPEYFGGYAAPVVALCFSQALRANLRMPSRLLWGGSGLFVLAALALSGSRGAFLGLAVALAIILVVQIPMLPRVARKAAIRLILAGGGLAVIGAVILSTPNPLNRRDTQLIQRFQDILNPRSVSVRERLIFYSITAHAIGENPFFGAGPGTYRLEFFPSLLRLQDADPRAGALMVTNELQNRVAEHPHNDYLEYWHDLGTVGIAALLLVLASLLTQFVSGLQWRSVSTDPLTAELLVLRTGFFASAMCLFTNALFSFPLHMPARGTLTWALVGCFLAADRLRDSQKSARN